MEQTSNQQPVQSQVPVVKSTNTFMILSIAVVLSGISFGISGYLIGTFNVKQAVQVKEAQQVPQSATTPTADPSGGDISVFVYRNYHGTVTWENVNNEELEGDLYLAYRDAAGQHKALLMAKQSLERDPYNFLFNDTGKQFIFALQYPDAHEFYLANTTPPFDVKKLDLPSNYEQQIGSSVLAWIGSTSILFSKRDGKTNSTTYWISPITNIASARQVLL